MRAAKLVIPLLAAGLNAGEQPWQALASLPEPNGGFVCGDLPGAIVVAGGTNWEGGQKQWLKTVQRLDLTTLRWSMLEPLHEPLAYALLGVNDDGLIIVGGTNGTAAFRGIVRVIGDKVFFDASPAGISSAVFSAGGRIGYELIWAGGTDDAADVKGFSRDVFALDLRTGERRPLAAHPGPGFGTAASALAGDELFVFGGAGWNVQARAIENLSDAYAFSPKQNAWRRLRSMPFAVRGLAAVALDDQRIYLAGGYRSDTEGFTGEGFIYDIGQDSYTPATPLPYSASVGLVKSGNFVYCIGGEDKPKHRSAAVFRIKLSDLKR